MSFLEHLDELRRRLIRSFIFIILATTGCWFLSGPIYAFLAKPVERALADAQQRQVPIAGQTGTEIISALTSLKENDTGRFVFSEETKLGSSLIPAGASVNAHVYKDAEGKLAFPKEPRALYVLTGSAFDAATGKVAGQYLRWVIYSPYATPESTGLSTKGSDSAPWLMNPGTQGAHIMINPPKK